MFGSLGCKGFNAERFVEMGSTLGASIPARFKPLLAFPTERELQAGLVLTFSSCMWVLDILMRVAWPTRSSFVPSHLKAGLRFSAM